MHDAASRLLTVREVAIRLRVCRATLYRLVQSGALTAVPESKSNRVPEHALQHLGR